MTPNLTTQGTGDPPASGRAAGSRHSTPQPEFSALGFVLSPRTTPLSTGRDHPLPHPGLTRGAGSLVLFLLLLFIVVLPARLGPCFPVTVRVLGLQHADGGGAGPAAVGESASPAATRPLRRGLDPLRGEGSSKLLCSLLQREKGTHHGQVLQLILLDEKKKDCIKQIKPIHGITVSICTNHHFPI